MITERQVSKAILFNIKIRGSNIFFTFSSYCFLIMALQNYKIWYYIFYFIPRILGRQYVPEQNQGIVGSFQTLNVCVLELTSIHKGFVITAQTIWNHVKRKTASQVAVKIKKTGIVATVHHQPVSHRQQMCVWKMGNVCKWLTWKLETMYNQV